MSPVGDLDQMLAQLRPLLRPGRYVFTRPAGSLPSSVTPVMTFNEDEGMTVIVAQSDADTVGLNYDLVLAWITLQVNSSLDGVGLTAAVSSVLAMAGISCNMVAAALHDHLFVPVEDASTALRLLQELSESKR